MRKRQILAVLACGLGLAIAGCGDDSGNGSAGRGGSAGSGGSAGDGGSSGDGGSAGTGGEEGNFAIITVGESVFTFPADPLNGCNSFNDTIGGSYAIDGDGNAVQAGGGEQTVQINFSLPVSETQGQQPPTLILDEIPADMRWQAIGVDDTNPGQIDSWTVTNGRAVGTASFMGSMIGSGAETGIVAGEFEILCAP